MAESIRDRDLAERVHSVAIRVLRRVRAADSESGLSAARLSALSVLVFGGPCSLRELAEAEQVTSATMSRLVSALRAEGLVTREPDPVDGRRVRVVATPAGREALEAGRARRVERLAALLGELDESGRASLSAGTAVLEALLGRG